MMYDCDVATRREYYVETVEGPRRAYGTATVAEMADVTAKTVTVWMGPDGHPPQPLQGWAPGTAVNPSGRWLIDADMVDAAFGVESPANDLAEERRRLDEERTLLQMERDVFERSRLEQLETENAKLRETVDKLRAQVAAMGTVVRELSETAGI